MSMDRTAYFEQRNERRAERMADEKYQRDLTRARTGEMAAAHLEGQKAIGQSEDQKYERSLERARSGEMAAANQEGLIARGLADPKPQGGGSLSPPPALSGGGGSGGDDDTPTAPPQTPDPEPITYDAEDAARPMARGGGYRDGEKLLVGEAGYPELVDTKRKTVTPLVHHPSGFRNTGASRPFSRPGLTAPEATVIAHQISERQANNTATLNAGTNWASAKLKAESDLEGHKVTAEGTKEAHRIAAEPNLIQANVLKTKADREHMAQFNSERDAEYNKILSSVDQNWPATVAKLEQKYREQNGSDMTPEMRGTILNSDQKTRIAYNRDMGTAEHGALLAMGLPKQGEAATRPGVLIAHGYEPQKDGSWTKEAVNPMSGTKYLDKFTPGPEGVSRSEEMIRPKRDQGPGMYREDGRWYGGNTSSPQQVPPRVMSIEQTLNPKVIASYNARADKYHLPQIGADLVAQNPAAAAWVVLTGVNKMNTDIGDPYQRSMGNDQRHLNAPTYVLNDADMQKAIKGHADWLNPSTAPPTAPPGTPPATTPDYIVAAREGGAAGAPGVAAVGPAPAVPGTAPAAPAVPAPGEVSEDPAVENWKSLGRNLVNAGSAVAGVAEAPINLVDRGAQNIVGAATTAARNLVPGAYKVFPATTPENPMGLRPGAPEAPASAPPANLAVAAPPAPRFDERAGWGVAPQYPQREAAGPVPGVVANRSVDAGVDLSPAQAPRSLANVAPPQRFDERAGWSVPAAPAPVAPAPVMAAPAPRFDERIGWSVPVPKEENIRPSAM